MWLQVYTVDIGVAVGQSCMLLAAGHKGHRFMLEHATGDALHSAHCQLALHSVVCLSASSVHGLACASWLLSTAKP